MVIPFRNATTPWILLVGALLHGSLLAWMTAMGQSVDTSPVVGLQDNRPNAYAIVGATILAAPGKTIANGTILVLVLQR